MAKSAWNRQQRLFERARDGDRGAWSRLEADAVPQLSSRLSKQSRLKIDRSEVEDLAREAFEAMALRAQDILSWPQAWTYASKVAVTLAVKRLREKKKHERLDTDLPLPDPGSERFVERIEAIDELEALVAKLAEKDARIVLAMVESIFGGEELKVPKIAREVGMSVRTVERRIRAIRRMARRSLE